MEIHAHCHGNLMEEKAREYPMTVDLIYDIYILRCNISDRLFSTEV